MNKIIEVIIILLRLFFVLSLPVLMGMGMRLVIKSAHQLLVALLGAAVIILVINVSPQVGIDSTIKSLIDTSFSPGSPFCIGLIGIVVWVMLLKIMFVFVFVLMGIALTDKIIIRRWRK